MNDPSDDRYRGYLNSANETFYAAYYQELASEALIDRWQVINIVILLFVALTASGSAISGWALWDEPGFKYVWVVIAAIASVLLVAHVVIGVPGRLRDQEEHRRTSALLRVDIEDFRQLLDIGIDIDEAKKRRAELQLRLAILIGNRRRDIGETEGFIRKVKENLNEIRRNQGKNI